MPIIPVRYEDQSTPFFTIFVFSFIAILSSIQQASIAGMIVAKTTFLDHASRMG